MHEPELLTRQRQALRAFRQTVGETARQEKGATKRVEATAAIPVMGKRPVVAAIS
jgi:hypothetical protein